MFRGVLKIRLRFTWKRSAGQRMRAKPVEEHGLPPGTNLAYLQSATGRRSAAIFIPCLFLGGHGARPVASCPSSVTHGRICRARRPRESAHITALVAHSSGE